MGSQQARTSNNPKSPVVYGKASEKSWLEFQLLDESGKPVANMPYKARNNPFAEGLGMKFSGDSDDNGIIRLENLYPTDICLTIDGDALAGEMEKRLLRVDRDNDASEVKTMAGQQKHEYRYVTIGELCDKLPSIAKPQESERQLSAFHFPNETFTGLKVKKLNCRYVLEICPFRAWALVLHHQKAYSLVNAYNLGILATLVYSTLPKDKEGSVFDFFFNQCQDLSKPPLLAAGGEDFYAVVEDVPFSQRYVGFGDVDTQGSMLGDHDTQLFYVYNKKQMIVAWRGSQEGRDWLTDFTYVPVSCPSYLGTRGKIHKGFLGAYEAAQDNFYDEFEVLIEKSKGKEIFICAHSLGGALALIHAVLLKKKDLKPLLYTYGMPRVFTGELVSSLPEITHYRHVNNADTVTSVPPDVNVDSWLHELYGPIGATLGYTWSALALAPQKITGLKLGDCYWHHGELTLFFLATQSELVQECKIPANPNSCRTLKFPLREKTKFYLVPNLAPDKSNQSGELQEAFLKSVDKASFERLFPKNTNPNLDSLTRVTYHFMSGSYMPFIHQQLIELVCPDYSSKEKARREKFIQQMDNPGFNISEPELKRNQCFRELQELLPSTLAITRSTPEGKSSLTRFGIVSGKKKVN